MKSLQRLGFQLVVGFLLAGAGRAQTGVKPAVSPTAVAVVRSVQMALEKDGPAVEIISNRPIVPQLTVLDGPQRLVIDLPNANIYLPNKNIVVANEQIKDLRLSQFQKDPPVARVVVDLLKPATCTWDAAGNRLMVRLRPVVQTAAKTAEAPSVPAFTRGTQPVAVAGNAGVPGAVMLAGSRIPAGSSVSAGADAAILHLARGGEVRVCPGTTVSVTTSQSGRELMLGMSTGALEAHYSLDASADSVLTPDFRILLAGPGEFHYAISADSRGNTCVRALPGNTSSVIVSELMGDGTYQVKPAEAAVFRSGRLAAVEAAIPGDCGCPAPNVPVLRTAAQPPPVVSAAELPASTAAKAPGETNPAPPAVTVSTQQGGLREPVTLSVLTPETSALPPTKPNEVHVQVEAPFVFRADDPPPVPPAPTAEALLLASASSRLPVPLESAALPPPTAKPARRGFFGKLKGFFAAIFR